MPFAKRDWLRLPSRIALLLGLGALTVGGAKADVGGTLQSNDENGRVPQQSAKPLAELLIWRDGGRTYISEGGQPAEELHLGNTVEAQLLEELLAGTTASEPRVLRDRIILVGGGGDGFHLQSTQATEQPSKLGTPAADDSSKSMRGSVRSNKATKAEKKQDNPDK